MALARNRRGDERLQLLAGLRRRALDADSGDHLPVVGVRRRAVLPVAGGQRQGQGAGAAERADRAAQRPAVAGEARQAQSRRTAVADARRSRRRRKRTRPRQGPLRRPCRAGQRRRRPRRRIVEGARFREADFLARAGDDRGAEPADQRPAPPARGAGGSARCLGEARQGFADPHRRARPAAERRAGAARAGAGALSFGILRPPARDPRQPLRHPHRRRPLRVPVGGVLRRRPGRAASRKAAPSSTGSRRR